MIDLECDEEMPQMDFSCVIPILLEDQKYLTFQDDSEFPVSHYFDCKINYSATDCYNNIIKRSANVKCVHKLVHILFSGNCWAQVLSIYEHDILPRAMQAGEATYRWQNWLSMYGWRRHCLDFQRNGLFFQHDVISTVTRAMRKHYKQQWLMLVFTFFCRFREYGILKQIHNYL